MRIKKYLLSLLLIFLLIIPSLADELQKVKINLFEGGQNSADLSSIINPNQGTLIQNAIINKKGQLFKRKGQSLFASDESNSAWTGIGVFNPDPNTSYLLAASGDRIVRTRISPSEWVIINPSSPLTSGKDTEFLQANNLFFVLNGYDYSPYYDGTNWFESSSGTASPPVASTACWLRNYLFTAGDQEHPDWIYWSDNLEPAVFQQGTNVVKVQTGDGQKITRIEAFKLNELVAYKEKSIFILDITGSTGWTLQPVTLSIGCPAPRSVINIGNDHWFLSSEPFAVRSLVRTSYDKLLIDMVSQPIQDIFDGTGSIKLNTTYASKACAILYDNKYFLAIPTGTSTVNNYVVVYDFIAKGWSVIDGWYPAEWEVFENNLYYIDALDGRVINCFYATYSDVASGPTTTSISEPTQAIVFDYRSKAIDFDNAENYKALDSLEVEFEAVGNYTAEIFINIDSGGWQSVGTVDFTDDVPTLPNTLPIALSSNNIAKKTFSLQRYGEFRKIQFRCVQNGVNQQCNLHSFCFFSRLRPWRRE